MYVWFTSNIHLNVYWDKTVNPFILSPLWLMWCGLPSFWKPFPLSLTLSLFSLSSLFADTFIRLTFLQPTCTFMVNHVQDGVGERRSDKCWSECVEEADSGCQTFLWILLWFFRFYSKTWHEEPRNTLQSIHVRVQSDKLEFYVAFNTTFQSMCLCFWHLAATSFMKVDILLQSHHFMYVYFFKWKKTSLYIIKWLFCCDCWFVLTSIGKYVWVSVLIAGYM